MDPSDSFSDNERVIEETHTFLLNKREHIRYFVNGLSAGDIGSVLDISSGGLRIMKMDAAEITVPELTLTVSGEEIKADVVWQNNNYIGLKYTDGFNADQLIKSHVRRVREPAPGQVTSISDDDLAAISPKDFLSSCIIFMAELESPDANLSKLKIYVEKISGACREPAAGDEDESDVNEEDKFSDETEDLKDLLLYKANQAFSSRGIKIVDIEFAMARLGLDTVKEISIDFLRHKIPEIELPLTGFENYLSFTVLKTVIFKNLTHFFNFNDQDGEGSLLLCLETKGIDALTSSCGTDVKKYYDSPLRIYSEISRTIETNCSGKDLLIINKIYFENELKIFKDLYDGYVLAHLTLNPGQTLMDHMQLALTKRKLVFSFLAYVSFLAARFIIDKDKESGYALTGRLKKTGMDNTNIMGFLNECIGKANDVLKDLGLHDKIRGASLPSSSFNIENYLLKDPHFRYFIKSLENFSILKSVTRMAIRYEDHAYTHFILGKFLIADEFRLNSKIYCVIPCINISDDDLYIEDFFYFDLLIFKDIDRLPGRHIKEFMKLWNGFEGKIIVTFSSYSFLDIDINSLYHFLKRHVVDFPSYFADPAIYQKMIDHTLNYMKPFTAERGIDKNKYLDDFFSMNYIKSGELSSYND